jgi:hypothetical protein
MGASNALLSSVFTEDEEERRPNLRRKVEKEFLHENLKAPSAIEDDLETFNNSDPEGRLLV